jgi:hypothetical protein
MIRKVLFWFCVLCLLLIAYIAGQDIPMVKQIPVFEGLRNTSAIIFGVMGAWLAILHPDSLKGIFTKGSKTVQKQDRETIKLLLEPIIISTVIIFIVLVLPLLVLIGKTITLIHPWIDVFRGLSFLILTALTILQIRTLLLSLLPSDIIQRALQVGEGREIIRRRLFSITKKKGD